MSAREPLFAGLWIEMDALVYFTISCSNIPLVYCPVHYPIRLQCFGH